MNIYEYIYVFIRERLKLRQEMLKKQKLEDSQITSKDLTKQTQNDISEPINEQDAVMSFEPISDDF